MTGTEQDTDILSPNLDTVQTAANIDTVLSNDENVNAKRWVKRRNLRMVECGGDGDCAYHVLSKATAYDDGIATLLHSEIRNSVAIEISSNRSEYDAFIVHEAEFDHDHEGDTVHETYQEFVENVIKVRIPFISVNKGAQVRKLNSPYHIMLLS